MLDAYLAILTTSPHQVCESSCPYRENLVYNICLLYAPSPLYK